METDLTRIGEKARKDQDLILSNEYFHGDNGADLVAKAIQQSGEPESS